MPSFEHTISTWVTALVFLLDVAIKNPWETLLFFNFLGLVAILYVVHRPSKRESQLKSQPQEAQIPAVVESIRALSATTLKILIKDRTPMDDVPMEVVQVVRGDLYRWAREAHASGLVFGSWLSVWGRFPEERLTRIVELYSDPYVEVLGPATDSQSSDSDHSADPEADYPSSLVSGPDPATPEIGIQTSLSADDSTESEEFEFALCSSDTLQRKAQQVA